MRKFFYVFVLLISTANVSFSDELVKNAQRLLNTVGLKPVADLNFVEKAATFC